MKKKRKEMRQKEEEESSHFEGTVIQISPPTCLSILCPSLSSHSISSHPCPVLPLLSSFVMSPSSHLLPPRFHNVFKAVSFGRDDKLNFLNEE